MLGMGSRVVEGEQRVEVLQCFLCYIAAHFLRLVQNDDWAVGLDDINWAAGSKIVTL